ncbi:iron-sulfur cluster assembly accessory protein [Rhodovarius crocodyli]|uniref:Iron-sulfur cluster assembly accessory protein n=1 Tax=Rhodovarius crocodyli TaxID=1979269 RepID=A0A437MEA8_9PROT|nr:iron-sulfur cluster assembly accessory protein [Rhodovarius crocodyli]RVT96013.1 iron-sulfur cluster assembly accessory protein [Rhodovarius crocodyli]
MTDRFLVTPRAAAEISSIATRQGQPGAALRVAVEAGGCSGMRYDFGLAEASEPDDLVVEQDGVRVLVDSTSLEFLEGATLDWHDSLMGSHFKVVNPQAASGCGCGVSFAV